MLDNKTDMFVNNNIVITVFSKENIMSVIYNFAWEN